MVNVGYYNGVIAPLEELMIPANDRSNYYGDGVYEAVYGRNCLRLTNILRAFSGLAVCSKLSQISRPMRFLSCLTS